MGCGSVVNANVIVNLDVCRNPGANQCAVKAPPLAYRLADRADAETKRQLKRAALSINLNIAEGTGRCDDAVLDALEALEHATRDEVIVLEELLVRIVSMLTKMTAR